MIEVTLITGEAGVGKSTYAHHLANKIHGEVVELSKPIKDLAYELGWNGEKDEYGRTLLQRLGREGREVSYKIWSNHLIYQIFRDIKLKQRNTRNPLKKVRYIVPDVRFDDEVEAIKRDFESVKVVRVYRKGFESKLTKEQKNDITERGVSPHLIDERLDLNTVFKNKE